MTRTKSANNDPAIKLLLIFTGKIFVPSGCPLKQEIDKHDSIRLRNKCLPHLDQSDLSQKWLLWYSVLEWRHVGRLSDSVNVIWFGASLQKNKAINAEFALLLNCPIYSDIDFLQFNLFNLAKHLTGCIKLNMFSMRKYKFSCKVREVLWVYWFRLFYSIFICTYCQSCKYSNIFFIFKRMCCPNCVCLLM